jgi:hypothetical protein
MARYAVHYVLELQDINGDRAVMRFPSLSVADTVTIATLVTNVASFSSALGVPGVVTNAKVVGESVTILAQDFDPRSAPLPIDAEFPSVADKARLQFSTPTGNRMSSSIPAPIEGIFHAPPSDDTVDPASAVSGLITTIAAATGDAGNTGYTIYLGGVRQKQRARRRKTHRS